MFCDVLCWDPINRLWGSGFSFQGEGSRCSQLRVMPKKWKVKMIAMKVKVKTEVISIKVKVNVESRGSLDGAKFIFVNHESDPHWVTVNFFLDFKKWKWSIEREFFHTEALVSGGSLLIGEKWKWIYFWIRKVKVIHWGAGLRWFPAHWRRIFNNSKSAHYTLLCVSL